MISIDHSKRGSGSVFVWAEAGCCPFAPITESATHDKSNRLPNPHWTEVGVSCLVQDLGQLTQLTALVLEGPRHKEPRQPKPGDADVWALAQLTRLQTLVSRLRVLDTFSSGLHNELPCHRGIFVAQAIKKGDYLLNLPRHQ